MSDDIIVTLRQEYEYFNAGKGGDYETILQAIDEIERLRTELIYYKKMSLHIAGKNFDANEEIHRLNVKLKAGA